MRSSLIIFLYQQSVSGFIPSLDYMWVNICIMFQQNKEGESWREKKTDKNSSSVLLENLDYDSDYQAEIYAVNNNGLSKPTKAYFSIPQGKVHHNTVLNFSSLIHYWILPCIHTCGIFVFCSDYKPYYIFYI